MLGCENSAGLGSKQPAALPSHLHWLQVDALGAAPHHPKVLHCRCLSGGGSRTGAARCCRWLRSAAAASARRCQLGKCSLRKSGRRTTSIMRQCMQGKHQERKKLRRAAQLDSEHTLVSGHLSARPTHLEHVLGVGILGDEVLQGGAFPGKVAGEPT